MTFLFSFALAACLTVPSGSDRIRAADLTPAFPQMSALAADTEIAFAPVPGAVRVFHAVELRRLAEHYGLAGAPAADLCIVRRVSPLDPERLLEAMHREFPAARIELIEFSRQPAPEGTIELPKTGLQPAAAGSVSLWRGWVRYGSGHRFVIWARVKIAIAVTRVLASVDLRPGQAIAPADVQLAVRDEVPGGAATLGLAESAAQVVGSWPRQIIRAGQAIRAPWLEAPKAVMHGQTVQVEVQNGGALLEFEARAETSGAVGQTVIIRNPASLRSFRARVAAKGKVRVGTGATEPGESHP